MGRVIYVDSGFFIALLDVKDAGWSTAQYVFEDVISDRTVMLHCSRDVINELLAHFSRSGPRARGQVARFVRRAFDDPKYRIEVVEAGLYSDALDLYEARHDKRYSMVDCIGMTIMWRDGIVEVATTDRDFLQEGFVNIMR